MAELQYFALVRIPIYSIINSIYLRTCVALLVTP